MAKPIIILGGGLWGSLLAYRLWQVAPDVEFILIEKKTKLGGNHTWCFFGTDLSKDHMTWLSPFIHKSWDAYSVEFPKVSRTLKTPYHAITSQELHDHVVNTLPAHRISLNTSLSLEEAKKMGAFVIDARGKYTVSASGFQKFAGLHIKTKRPHGLEHPIIMDATVQQKEGFRFIYYLPWSEDTLLIEDTRYSLNPEILRPEFSESISLEIMKRGWEISEVFRAEEGSLPIPLEPISIAHDEQVVSLAGLFHDTTGYSLPIGVKLIDKLVAQDFSLSNTRKTVSHFRDELERKRKFYRTLNLLLFKASKPEESYRMLEFFYTHPDGLIQRFYSGELSVWDHIRFFIGKPPVKIGHALKSLLKVED